MQSRVWAVGGLLLCLGFRGVARDGPDSPQPAGAFKTRWQWWVLPAISSATLLATTNQLSYEAGAGPLAWASPLAFFLGSYVWAFSGDRAGDAGIISIAGLVALTAVF